MTCSKKNGGVRRSVASFRPSKHKASNDNSLPESVIAFETRWDEAKWVRDITKGSDKKRKRHPGNDNSRFVERVLSRKEAIRRRLDQGFKCFGEEIGGRYRTPFEEAGLRSHDHHLLRRIVQLTPKAKRLQSGRAKDVMSCGDVKLLALDEPWLVLNPEFRAVFRIDLDFTYRSWGSLRHEIEQLMLPCVPHIAVGFELPNGCVERPHLLYFLPFGSEVWVSREDDRCRTDIISLWKGVHSFQQTQRIVCVRNGGNFSYPRPGAKRASTGRSSRSSFVTSLRNARSPESAPPGSGKRPGSNRTPPRLQCSSSCTS